MLTLIVGFVYYSRLYRTNAYCVLLKALETTRLTFIFKSDIIWPTRWDMPGRSLQRYRARLSLLSWNSALKIVMFCELSVTVSWDQWGILFLEKFVRSGDACCSFPLPLRLKAFAHRCSATLLTREIAPDSDIYPEQFELRSTLFDGFKPRQNPESTK